MKNLVIDFNVIKNQECLTTEEYEVVKTMNPKWANENLRKDDWVEGRWLNMEAITTSQMRHDEEQAYYESGEC